MSNAAPFRVAVVVPSHNHWRAIPDMLDPLTRMGLPVWIIDDGSDGPVAAALTAMADPSRRIAVHRLPVNQGKGRAVKVGFQLAHAAGFSHVLQIDADGQHSMAVIETLVKRAQQYPGALISGRPIYDHTIPTGRKIGRWITHLWVFFETLSLRITDSMCGLRVYPLAPVLALLHTTPVGDRMDFDTDIMVRLFWRGVAPLFVPVQVTYPQGNHSNFRLWRDNWAISVLHTRLVLTLLWRWPAILRNRPPPLEVVGTDRPPAHWSGLAERGVVLGLRIAMTTLRWLGRRTCFALMVPVTGYFFLSSRPQRQASMAFLRRVHPLQGNQRSPTWRDGLRHFLAYTRRGIDLFSAWNGDIPPSALWVENPDALRSLTESPKGAVLVVSHLGNVELSRALMPSAWRRRLTVLVHTIHAQQFNRLLGEVQPEAISRFLQVTEIGPETAILLRERVEQGEWIAIAGDRTPVSAAGQRVGWFPFLGDPAPFPQGPWILASLLECPVYLFFCRREGEHWRLMVEHFSDRVILPRTSRRQALEQLQARFVARLERECLVDPLQWGNFFDFWAFSEGEK
ncbi:MAG: glycosyltransferase family 2 protein [Magnetococcales bacterium]|nr:glycosyltransferase family 2 protein [Magnetococcales bacterium]